MHAPTARIFGLPAAACRAKNPRNCLARLPPVFPRKSVVSSSTRGRFWAYEAVNPRFPPEKQGLDALNNYVQDRAHFEAGWANQVDNVAFPGQQDPAIIEPIWQSLMARDPLGSTWGTDGLMRFPSADYWGWNPDQHQASRVTVPALVLIGQLDATLVDGPVTAVRLYDDLGSDKKVLIKVDGGSHQMVWEGSTSPTWRGPHATLQDAVVQWVTSETYQGATRGTFDVHANGRIEQGPAKVTSVVV